MTNTLIRLLIVAALAYLAVCAALFLLQHRLTYMPPPPSALAVAGTGATMLTLPVNGAELRVTVINPQGAKALIYFGGNAEDVNYTAPELTAAMPGHSIYLPHYRGYGGSTGKATEQALVADALALFDQVQRQHASVEVVGRSLGSGVAVQLASARPVARLVLVTPYDSILEVAAGTLRYFPVRWILRDTFESWRYASRVRAPTLLISAENDELIPRARTEALLPHFPKGQAALKVIAGTGHNTISHSAEYIPLLRGTP